MRGILLDRDGVINRERADYVKNWDEFEFLPGALTALRALASLDAPIAVITNQSVIGRGLVDRVVIDAIHTRLCATVRAAGGRIDAVFVCPHAGRPLPLSQAAAGSAPGCGRALRADPRRVHLRGRRVDRLRRGPGRGLSSAARAQRAQTGRSHRLCRNDAGCDGGG